MDKENIFLGALEELICLADKNWNNFYVESSGLWSNKKWLSSSGKLKSFEISYISRGSSLLLMNRERYSAVKGDFYFSDLWESSSCDSAGIQLYYITFKIKKDNLHTHVKSCFKKLAACIQSPGLAGMEELFAAFNFENTVNRPYSELLSRNYFLSILTSLYRHLKDRRDNSKNITRDTHHRKTTYSIIRYLDENYSTPIELRDLGKMYSLDPRHLNNVFKKQTGFTIIKYLIHIRIEKAKRLLIFTAMSITAIALDTGFYDCQHFCKVFHRLEGITPTDFRNLLTR